MEKNHKLIPVAIRLLGSAEYSTLRCSLIGVDQANLLNITKVVEDTHYLIVTAAILLQFQICQNLVKS